MPEEINRVPTDHAADLLLAPAQVAAGQHRPLELTAHARPCAGGRRAGPGSGLYSPAMIHRAENTDDAARLSDILDSLAEVDHPVVLLAHPRLVAKCGQHCLSLTDRGALRVLPPLAYPDLIASALHARGVITDSGGLQKEAFLLRVPCTTVRPQTEWVETVELGWNTLVEPGPALRRAASRPRPAEPAPERAHPYGDGRAAGRVAQVLLAEAR